MDPIDSFTLMVDTIVVSQVMWILFLIKHLVADYLYQTPWMFENKHIYRHPGGWAHAGFHVILSIPVLLVLFWLWAYPVSGMSVIVTVLGLSLFELLVHHLTDWTKQNYIIWSKLLPNNAGWWRAFGTDQTIHGLTYVAMGWFWWAVVLFQFPRG